MINIKTILITLFLSVLVSACSNNDDKADGYGNFEATEITVSAEKTGKLMAFTVEEGTVLEQNRLIGYIDTIPLHLKKEQLKVQNQVINSRSKGVLSQIDVLQAKLKTANINKKRVENLIKDKASTQKQLDDVVGEIDIIKNQIKSVEAQNESVINELKSIDIQLQQIEDQIQKSKIINPIKGTVLSKYTEPNEIVAFGKPLYKIADLSRMELRVYVSETQLANISIGEKVSVKIDDQKGMKTYEGTVSWISSEAEFTPKVIQTKEERVALVYAVKVMVENDGSLKVGMPGEMWLTPKSN